MAKKKQRHLRSKALQSILLLLVVGLILWLLLKPNANLVPAHFKNSNGKITSEIYLEIVDTDEKRTKGLMFRKEIPENYGMLFIFPESHDISMWMKNTYIPLDMVFMDEAKKITGILENIPVLNTEPRNINKQSKYVLELRAGRSKSLSLKQGDMLVLESDNAL